MRRTVVRSFALVAALALSAPGRTAGAAAVVGGTAPGAPTAEGGRVSWSDPSFPEVLEGAELVVVARVVRPGLMRAEMSPETVLRGARPPDPFVLVGFNSHEWNAAFHQMRLGERTLLFLARVSGAEYALPTPSSGKFPLSADGASYYGCLADGGLPHRLEREPLEGAIRLYDEARAEARREGRGTSDENRPKRSAAEALLVGLLEAAPPAGTLESQHMAAEMLGALARACGLSARAERALERALDPASPKAIRLSAARALGRFLEGSGAEPAGDRPADPARERARAALEALLAEGAPAATDRPPSPAGSPRPSGGAVSSARGRSALAEAAAEGLAGSGDPAACAALARWLLREAAPAGPGPIARPTRSRERALAAVERNADASAEGEILALVASGDSAGATAAVAALGRMRSLRALPALAALAKGRDARLARAALRAIRRITLRGDPEAVDPARPWAGLAPEGTAADESREIALERAIAVLRGDEASRKPPAPSPSASPSPPEPEDEEDDARARAAEVVTAAGEDTIFFALPTALAEGPGPPRAPLHSLGGLLALPLLERDLARDDPLDPWGVGYRQWLAGAIGARGRGQPAALREAVALPLVELFAESSGRAAKDLAGRLAESAGAPAGEALVARLEAYARSDPEVPTAFSDRPGELLAAVRALSGVRLGLGEDPEVGLVPWRDPAWGGIGHAWEDEVRATCARWARRGREGPFRTAEPTDRPPALEEVPKLLERLRAPLPKGRVRLGRGEEIRRAEGALLAGAFLSAPHAERVVAGAIALGSSADGPERAIGANLLGLLARGRASREAAGSAEAARALARLAGDGEALARLEALWALGEGAGSGSAERARDAARLLAARASGTGERDASGKPGPPSLEREAAVLALGRLGGVRPEVRGSAATALAGLLANADDPARRETAVVRRLAVTALARLGPGEPAGSALVGALAGDPHPGVRAAAARALPPVAEGSSREDRRRIVEGLREALARSTVTEASPPGGGVAGALARLAGPEDAWTVASLLSSRSLPVREVAAEILAGIAWQSHLDRGGGGEFGMEPVSPRAPAAPAAPRESPEADKAAAAAAWALRNDPDDNVRVACARAIGLLGSRPGAPVLRSALLDIEPEAASAAAEALARLGDASGLDRLREDRAEAARFPDRAVYHALGRVGAAADVAWLVAQTREQTYPPQRSATEALGLCRSPAALGALLELWRNPHCQFRDVALRGLRAGGTEARKGLAVILAPPPPPPPPSPPSPLPRGERGSPAEELPPPPPVPTKPGAVALPSWEASLRAEAAAILGETAAPPGSARGGLDPALPALLSALDDGEPLVRRAADRSIRAILGKPEGVGFDPEGTPASRAAASAAWRALAAEKHGASPPPPPSPSPELRRASPPPAPPASR